MADTHLSVAARPAREVSPRASVHVYGHGERVDTTVGPMVAARLRPGDRVFTDKGRTAHRVLWLVIGREDMDGHATVRLALEHEGGNSPRATGGLDPVQARISPATGRFERVCSGMPGSRSGAEVH